MTIHGITLHVSRWPRRIFNAYRFSRCNCVGAGFVWHVQDIYNYLQFASGLSSFLEGRSEHQRDLFYDSDEAGPRRALLNKTSQVLEVDIKMKNPPSSPYQNEVSDAGFAYTHQICAFREDCRPLSSLSREVLA